jgi:hypothetical protein
VKSLFAKVTNPLKQFFWKLICDIVCLGSYMIKKRGKKCNILVLKCIGCVELSRTMMMAFKTIMKLRFDVSITP